MELNLDASRASRISGLLCDDSTSRGGNFHEGIFRHGPFQSAEELWVLSKGE
jgi:hypothetical protein